MTPSNSSGDNPEFDVFLNFRGRDLRDRLMHVLCHFLREAGIRFFYDDKSIRSGDVIHDTILRNIRDSHIYIVLLSKNYAESKWCMRELAQMMKCWEESNGQKEILPFFCDVSVDNVKLKQNKEGTYKETLNRLYAEERELPQWEEALKKVTQFKGVHMETSNNVEFSQVIVREAQSRLGKRRLSYHLVGNFEDKHLEKILKVKAGGVRFVVIFGKQGAGKTTLARTILQQLSPRFEGSSFISDVRNISKDCDLEARVKSKMLRDICGDHGKCGDIKKDLRDKKVLIVLDDVENPNQIKNLAGASTWFGPGSRIIITTPNREVLLSPEAFPPGEVSGHEVGPMELEEGLKLFSRYAFWQDSPPPGDYKDLSHQIFNYADGLPLILEVMGSLLHGKTKVEWEEIFDQLKGCINLQAKLKISYDKLDGKIQEIFLDVACFFVNVEKTNPLYMWGKEDGLEYLLMLSLVKFMDGDKLWMHDYVRDLGRDITRDKSQDIARANSHPSIIHRCRVWEHKEASEVLEIEGEAQRVVGICFPHCRMEPDNLELTPAKFSVKRHLRFLKLYYARFKGDFKNKVRELRWLSWHYGPHFFEATNFGSASLIILDLAQSRIEDGWNAWEQLEVNNDLKVIDLTKCEKITKTPSFSKFTKLERLILEDCTKLTKIDSSIKKLEGLKCLNIKGCDSLQGLPDEICSIKTLTEILISKKETRALATGKKEREKTRSFSLPGNIGSLESLAILEIVNVEINVLPMSIGSLKRLHRLSLLGCSGYEKLPESMGNMQSLAELQISGAKITGLPQSFRDLKELKVIKMEKSLIRRLPRSISKLRKLEELHAKLSQHLEGDIPDGIRKLSHLKILDLSHTSVGKLPKTVSHLSHLQKLQCGGALQNLAELPTNLVSLGITVPAESQVPNLLEGLTRLEKLELHVPHDTNFSPEFRFPDKLKSLLLSYSNSGCCLELPSNLSELILENMEVHPRLYLNMGKLSHLKLNKCHLDIANEVREPIEGHESLMYFPKDLRGLDITQSKFLHPELRLSGLNRLQQLKISSCEGLVELKGLGELESLEELIIHSCVSLERLGGDISHSEGLQVFKVSNNHELKEIEGYEGVCSMELNIECWGKSLNFSNR